MNSLPLGTYLENEKRFEFDFIEHLLKISFFKGTQAVGAIVSPFRLIKDDGNLYLLIHNYDKLGDLKVMIESINDNELVINDDDTSYQLKKVDQTKRKNFKSAGG